MYIRIVWINFLARKIFGKFASGSQAGKKMVMPAIDHRSSCSILIKHDGISYVEKQ